MAQDFFRNRKLLIATKHGKEAVIAPLLEQHLDVRCFTRTDLDTDSLGTFTGEIARHTDPVTTVRKKCHWALEQSDCDLVVASEGSFGSHPSLYFLPADEEFLMLVDIKNNLEIVAKVLSTETNFDGAEVRTEAALLDFAEKAQFPSHALILRPTQDSKDSIYKGLKRKEELLDTFHRLQQEFGSTHVETDMRAMNNPSRMRVIALAAKNLVEILHHSCPQCATPGFAVRETKKGLPCENCGLPTPSIKSVVYSCQKCGNQQEKMYPNGKEYEDPSYCNFCNP